MDRRKYRWRCPERDLFTTRNDYRFRRRQSTIVGRVMRRGKLEYTVSTYMLNWHSTVAWKDQEKHNVVQFGFMEGRIIYQQKVWIGTGAGETKRDNAVWFGFKEWRNVWQKKGWISTDEGKTKRDNVIQCGSSERRNSYILNDWFDTEYKDVNRHDNLGTRHGL